MPKAATQRPFRLFEGLVIRLCDGGVLAPAVLERVIGAFAQSGIDWLSAPGGRSVDKRSLHEIVVRPRQFWLVFIFHMSLIYNILFCLAVGFVRPWFDARLIRRCLVFEMAGGERIFRAEPSSYVRNVQWAQCVCFPRTN